MAKHMLIDATHPEEIRVVVVDGKRLEEFDIELASKKQLKGNIYLAKVTRVEPSLQAAFVEYGGNRHGFLAFSEIHPDYYRIPVADREALLAEEAREAAAESAREEARDAADEARTTRRGGGRKRGRRTEAPETDGDADEDDAATEAAEAAEADEPEIASDDAPSDDSAPTTDAPWPAQPLEAAPDRLASNETYDSDEPADEPEPGGEAPATTDAPVEADAGSFEPSEIDDPDQDGAARAPASDAGAAAPRPVEVIGGDEIEEVQPRRSPRGLRSYKIQEVIKRRQVMLVQVTKEERGTKGAALTTYLSLAGRYCVLMPNTARGGGVSRKISNPADRKRLKSILEELDIPEGMAVIIRTAGAERSKAELKRDYEYLLRLWDEIRELTLKSSAPSLVYEEANLIKRSIRDLYSRDLEDVIVDGEEGYKVAKAFMRTLTPSHAKRVQLYRDPMPLFHRHQVESQLDAIHNPVVQLRSGGYIVINSTEALVAIDVNSGRATRERNIEETAYKTNLEAAEEVARQLRLRDLAGLIVIDFIDMEESRHNAAVERRLKESMRSDRARIQIGRVSAFGLLELSRQRMRPSLFETSTEVCQHCRGTGHVRSTESTVLHVLRSVEDECLKSRNAEGLSVAVPTPVALYILNHKRKALAEIELRHGLRIFLSGDDHLIPPEYRVERLKALAPGEQVRPPVIQATAAPALEDEDERAEDESAEDESVETGQADAARDDGEGAADDRRRPRRRRRGKDRERGHDRETGRGAGRGPGRARDDMVAETPAGVGAEVEGRAFDTDTDDADAAEAIAGADESSEESRRRRRRGRRGGRRRRRGGEEARPAGSVAGGDTDDATGESLAAEGAAPVNGASPALDQGADQGAAENDEIAADDATRERGGRRRRSRRRRGGPAEAETAEINAPEAPAPAESEAAAPEATGASAPEIAPEPAPEPAVEQRWAPQREPLPEPPVEPVPEPAAAEAPAPSPAETPAERASEPAASELEERHRPESPAPTAPEREPEAKAPATSRRRGWWRRLAE